MTAFYRNKKLLRFSAGAYSYHRISGNVWVRRFGRAVETREINSNRADEISAAFGV